MKTYLKIKIKSLAEEAKLIRAEERKFKKHAEGSIGRQIFWGLRGHRIKDVRSESRSALLAYGFLRGRSYLQMEPKCEIGPDWKRVEAIVMKYAYGAAAQDVKQRFADWKDGKKADDKAAIAA